MKKPKDLDSAGNPDPAAVKRAVDEAENDLRKVGVHEVSIEAITAHVAIALASDAKKAGWNVRTRTTENGPVLVIEHPSFSMDQFGAFSAAASKAIRSSNSRGTSKSSGRMNDNDGSLAIAIGTFDAARKKS